MKNKMIKYLLILLFPAIAYAAECPEHCGIKTTINFVGQMDTNKEFNSMDLDYTNLGLQITVRKKDLEGKDLIKPRIFILNPRPAEEGEVTSFTYDLKTGDEMGR